jgi:hypothetical protein
MRHDPAGWPAVRWKRPAAQPTQAGEPGGVAVPGPHCLQVPETSTGLYLPLGQSVHLVEPSAEDLPAAQLVQVVEEVLG